MFNFISFSNDRNILKVNFTNESPFTIFFPVRDSLSRKKLIAEKRIRKSIKSMKCDWEEEKKKTKKGSDEKRPFLEGKKKEEKRTAESQLRSARQNGKTRNDGRRCVFVFGTRKGCFSFPRHSFSKSRDSMR